MPPVLSHFSGLTAIYSLNPPPLILPFTAHFLSSSLHFFFLWPLYSNPFPPFLFHEVVFSAQCFDCCNSKAVFPLDLPLAHTLALVCIIHREESIVCLPNTQADEHIQIKCLHTVCTDTHTSARAHSEAYPPPLRSASHSPVRPCNRDSYIRRIFSGPCLLQSSKTSLCHNTSHDHTSTGLNEREKETNDLHFES